MRKIIVFNSREAALRESLQSTFTFSYSLPETLHFEEPHAVRLLSIIPRPNTVVFIQPDFVAPQIVQDRFEPFLAASGASHNDSWVDLAVNEIPAIGLIRIRNHNGNAIGANTNFTIIIEVASKVQVQHGT